MRAEVESFRSPGLVRGGTIEKLPRRLQKVASQNRL